MRYSKNNGFSWWYCGLCCSGKKIRRHLPYQPSKKATMNTSVRKLCVAGFTLIELLIVVIIIAILAAIAIPQFSNTTGDAQEATLDANLNNLRSAIELYRVQHNNAFPAAMVSSGGDSTKCQAANGTLGSGAVNTADGFREQLTMFSDAAGHTCSAAGAGFIYGPYLRDHLPAEPISNVSTVVVDPAASAATAPSGTAGGWRYNYQTGRIDMNSNANDRRGNAYYTH
jgi:general secretion pathway protein G